MAGFSEALGDLSSLGPELGVIGGVLTIGA